VQSEPTVKSPQWAQLLVNAVDDETVVASAPVSQALIEELSKQMTPSEVAAGMKLLFSGAGPRLALLSPDAVSLPAVNAALSAAEKAAPAVRQADRKVSMDSLPRLGAAGKEVSRQRIEDLGVTIVRFANGTTLLFKQTDFEKGSVQVQLRFGEGITGLSPTQPSYTWLGGLVSPSGFADFDLDAMERLLTGRRMNISFGVDEDAFVLRGATNGTDLPDQLRLLATKLAYPRWDAPLFARFQAELSRLRSQLRLGIGTRGTRIRRFRAAERHALGAGRKGADRQGEPRRPPALLHAAAGKRRCRSDHRRRRRSRDGGRGGRQVGGGPAGPCACRGCGRARGRSGRRSPIRRRRPSPIAARRTRPMR
jgi:hypothetical protein